MKRFCFVVSLSLLIVYVAASVPIQTVKAQESAICGWVDIIPAPPGSQALYDYVMTVSSTGETISLAQPFFLEGWPDPQHQQWATQFHNVITQPGYYQLTNPVIDRGTIVLFDQAKKVETCESSLASIPVLEVTDFQVEPSQSSVYEMVRIKIVIENKGVPLNQPFWGYSGEVVLENGNGESIEKHSFARGDASSISPVIEGGQINFEKWLLTVKVRFGTAVSNGQVIVSIQPDGQQSALQAKGSLTVNAGISGLTCTSVVVNKLIGPFSSDTQRDLLDVLSAELQSAGCRDGDFACAAPPLVKGLVKVLGRGIFGSIGKIIIGVWGVFDTDALQVCRDPINSMWQLVREFNRQGVPISVSGSHSPVIILVTNSAGQRAGFVSDDEIVTDIPESRVIEWEGDKYVIYPADNNITISLKGMGTGTASLSLIDGQSGREVSFSNIPVSDGSGAQLDLSTKQFQLFVDTNGDGNIDEVRNPESVETLLPIETPTVSPPSVSQPTGICGGSVGLIILPFLMMFVLRRFHQHAR